MNSFTHDLLVWIENNLEKKVLLDNVSDKAGYSKWYLQRIFRGETGISLATYIRHRKLSRAAVMLKMTSLGIIDISEKLGYSTQQTFTRTFKRHFGVAPGIYRGSPDWHFVGLMPELSGEEMPLPKPQRVMTSLYSGQGIILSYLCSSARLNSVQYHHEQRRELFRKAGKIMGSRSWMSVAQNFEPACANDDEIKFSLTFSTDPLEINADASEATAYLRFPFHGTSEQLTEMQVNIYRHVMPFRQEARRSGHDFFIFEYDDECTVSESGYSGAYYVPVATCEPE